ncbi:MAG TPA: NmrA family NAD(P)-binding protein [Myxococcaceae bacterium]|nr:NmrA family NAD(P)-binding protein [Myxococcaceae bacterium]
MAEYVVAGVTGHTGSVVAQTLLDSGRKVRVLVRDPHKAERWKKRGAHVGQGDLSSPHDLLNALRGTEAAYLLLPPLPPATTGVRGKAKKMIDAMVQAIGGTDVKHVVFVSSHGAQHADGTGPVVLLHDAEQELKTLKTPVTFLRACYFMENWAPALPDAKEGLLNTFLPPELKWPQVAVHDVGQTAAHLLLEHPKQHRVVELSGPEDVGPADVARVLSKLLETEVEPLVEPLDQAAEAFKTMGFSPELAAMYQQLYEAIASRRLSPEHPESLVRGKDTLEQALAAMLAKL